MDQFALEKNLFINAKSFKTPFGGCVTLIQIILSVIIIVIFTLDYINKEEFVTKVYSEEMAENIKNYYFSAIVSYPKLFLNKSRWVSSELMNFTINPFEECDSKNYKKFYNDLPRNESLIYYCFEKYEPNKAYNYNFILVNCSFFNSYEQFWKIHDLQCVEDLTTEENNLFEGELIVKYLTFNESDFKNEKNDVELKTEKININLYKWSYFKSDFRKSIFDLDYFFSNPKTYHSTSVEFFSPNSDNSEYLYKFEIYHSNYFVKTVSITKITNLLSRIFGILQVINLFSYFITNFVSEFYYRKYVLNNLFDEKDYEFLFNKFFLLKEFTSNQSIIKLI